MTFDEFKEGKNGMEKPREKIKNFDHSPEFLD